jgi:hypothetical protein
VGYLGFEAIRNLTLSIEIFAQWQAGPHAGLDLDRLQRHVQAVAAAANSLTARTVPAAKAWSAK